MEEESVIWRTPKDATTSSAERQGLDYEQSEIAETTAKGSGITPQSTSSADKVTESSPSPQENGPKNSTQSAVESASAEVETSPTEAQKKAGNYKMGHVKVGAFDVTIENPRGSERSGTDANGKKWSVKMNNTYGYIRGTEGVSEEDAQGAAEGVTPQSATDATEKPTKPEVKYDYHVKMKDGSGNAVSGRVTNLSADGVEIEFDAPYNGKMVDRIPLADFDNGVSEIADANGNVLWNETEAVGDTEVAPQVDATPTQVGQNKIDESEKARQARINSSEYKYDKEMRVYGYTGHLYDYRNGVAIYLDEEGNPLIYLAAQNDNTYIGLFRDDSGMWSTKMENASNDKTVFKGLISAVMDMLPEGAKFYEHSNVSVDGLRVFAQQLNHGFKVSDETYECGLNGEDKANVLGSKFKGNGKFVSIEHATEADLEYLKGVLKPYMEALGRTTDDIRLNEDGKVLLTLPILIKEGTNAKAGEDVSASDVSNTQKKPTQPIHESASDEVDAKPAGSQDEAHKTTALERIPVNEAGERMFEQADKETALDALDEMTGHNSANTAAIVKAQYKQAQADLDKLKKKAPTRKEPVLRGTPMEMLKAQQEADANYNTAMTQYNAQVAEAEAKLDAWTKIYALMNERERVAREQAEAEQRERDKKLHDEAVAKLEEQKRIAAEKAAEQEAVGTHAVNPKIKKKWNDAVKIEGNANAITLADGSTIRGRYVLTESGAATASHYVNNAYEPTEGFPIDENGESVNDRDYKRDKDAQRIVREMADNYDSRALQTPIIVSKDGVVLSGNNRTMSGELAAQQGTDKAYIDYLREFGKMFGFTSEQIEGMKHPRVVFVLDEALPYDAKTFARFNAEQQKRQSKPEHAVKLGKIVPDSVFASITNDISRFDRMSDFYADEKSVDSAISKLLEAGVINEMQLPELRTGNSLSASGKELIENALIGKVFQSSPDAVRQIIGNPTLRQSIIMGLNEIANNRTLAKSGYDLSQELGAAVDLVARAKTLHPDIYKEGVPVSPFGREQGLFDDEYGDSRVTDGIVLLLADLLNSGKPSELRKVLASYNNEAADFAVGQIDMFSGEVTSKEKLLNNVLNHFRNATPKEQQAIVDAAIAERKRRAEASKQVGDTSGRSGSDVTNAEVGNSKDAGNGQQDSSKKTNTEKITPIGESDFGFVYDQFKGNAQGAIQQLMKMQDGEALGALHHDEIGDIDLVWGKAGTKKSDGYGLAKLVKFHPEVLDNLQGILDGMHITMRSENRVQLESDEYQAAVRLTWNGKEKLWLLTAFKKKETPEPTNSRTDVDSNLDGKSDDTATRQSSDVSADKVTESSPSPQENGPKNSTKSAVENKGLKPVRFEAGRRLTKEEKKEVLNTLRDAFKENGVPYHIEESDFGKERRVYEPTSEDWVKSDITGRPLRYYITLPDGRVAHPTELFPNISGREVTGHVNRMALLEKEASELISKQLNGFPSEYIPTAISILEKMQSLPHDVRDMGYGPYFLVSYDYIFNGKHYGNSPLFVSLFAHSVVKESSDAIEATVKVVNNSYYMVDALLSALKNKYNSTQSAVESASAEVETSPTEAQKKAGNYKMGHVKVGAFDVTIENPKGSERSGTDANGKKWSVKMNNTYGYIRGTEGVDGDHIDVFLAEDMDKWDGKYVFVVDQYNPDGTFDEHKVMLGFNSTEEARSAYLSNYEKGWENGRRIDVARIKTDGFQKWVDSSHRKTKPFAHYVIAGAADVAEGKPKNESDRAIPPSTSGKVRMQKTQDYSEFAEKYGVNADDVRAYAEGMALGNVVMANQAFTEIRRTKRIEHRGMKLSEFAKAFNPIKEELYEKFGNVDELNQEYVRRAEEERNMMEAARKKAEEEERKRQAHLDELSLLDDAAIDERYMEALQRGDEATAREMLDEAARRKGYGDTASDYQGVGAWVAPANPGYENDAERRADVEDNAPDVNIEDIALGYSLVDEKYWKEPRKYMQTDATAIESVNAIREAIAAVRRGEKNVKVKVYRAVPTSVKEGKLRNGDWVTPSKDYAKMHGEHRLEGKYRIIEDEVSVNDLWWDGNDSREWGFDNGKGYKYKNVKNNRKSDDLVTRDDKGNVIPPSKRFNQRKADERYQKAGTPLTPNSAEVALRDAIADLMRKSGLDVIESKEGQRVLDIANGRGTRLSAKQKRALETVTIADESTNNATAISSADGAKIQKNLESLAEGYSNRSNKSKGFITDLSQSLNLEQHEASHYGTFVTENGKTVTIRVSNHNARVSNFDRNGEIDGISIVISSHGNKGLNNDGNAHIVEFFYSKQSLERSEGKPLADIIRSVSTALKNGEFKDNTGLAQRQEVNEQTIREHRVYHGSGADFDHFDHSHMGEGEGAQVYGWGTYVTEVKGIGEGYAIRSMNGSSMSHDELSLKRSELEYYIASAKEKLPFLKGEYKAEVEAQISEWEEQLKDYEEHNYLYTVEIPDDNGSNYLDWDKNTGVDLVNRIRETLRKNADLKELYDGSELNAELEHLAPKIPFSETYIFLYELLGSDKAASQMLHDMGFTGIKYPADYRQGGRADGAKNYVIFNEEDAKITDRIRFFRTSNGEAYGFTVGGKIYIDPRIATAETPIHEYAHLWATAMREGNPTEWKNIVGLMKGTSVWAEVQKLYPELKNDDDIADEVLATFSGRRGAERLRAEQQKIMQGDGSVFEKAAAVGALARVKQALSKFWKGVADFLGIHYTSAEEVADRVMKDLLEGVDPRKFGVSGVLRESIRLPKTEYAKVAHAIATNKGLKNKGINWVFTDNNYYIYTANEDGYFAVEFGLPIRGNENFINELIKGIGNGTIRDTRSLHSVIERERSKPNRNNRNNADAEGRQRSTGRTGNLALRQQTNEARSDERLGSGLYKSPSTRNTDRRAGRETGGVDDNLYRQGEDTPHTATSSESKSQSAQKATENLNLGGRVVVHESAEGLEGKEATAKGWYDTKTGQIHVVLSSNADVADVTQTILHEAVAHHGLRELFGHNVIDAFLDSVLATASQEVKDAINELRRGKGWNFRTATEEYLAGRAERTDFERMTAEERGLFATLRRLFNRALEFLGLKNRELSDRELAYILWCSYQNLKTGEKGRYVAEAERIAMRYKLKAGKNAMTDTEKKEHSVLLRGELDNLQEILAKDTYERLVTRGSHLERTAWVDMLSPLQDLQHAIEKNGGFKLGDFENPYNAYITMSSRNYAQMDIYKRTLYADMIEAIYALGSETGRSYEEIKTYVMAKHGMERQKYMAGKAAEEAYDRYKSMHPFGQKTLDYFIDEYEEKSFAGLTELFGTQSVSEAMDEAQKYVEEVEAEAGSLTDSMWDSIRAATKSSLQRAYEAGLISKETYDNVSSMYQYYIPLRGFDEATSDEVYEYFGDQTINGGTGSFMKKAKGRKSVADDPFAVIGNMAEMAIMQSNRNLMKQQLLNLALNHPSDLISVSDLYVKILLICPILWKRRFTILSIMAARQAILL